MNIYNNVLVVGANGAIGSALVKNMLQQHDVKNIYAVASHKSKVQSQKLTCIEVDYTNELSIQDAARTISCASQLDLIIVATGILHTQELTPEKSIQQISISAFQEIFMANTILPALIAKHFLPLLNKNTLNTFAALSARVGSINDNKLGGWHSYRASKAALNMLIKNISIEQRRINKKHITVGLHPGTVDSKLSKPFQSNVAANKLFNPDRAAQYLLNILYNVKPQESGQCIAWDGTTIQP
jgi:NAD(P)-dependent dehydrogenase (short-subunit alcohol dehydrogenase family)